jgi:hypothetical protein
MLDLNGKDWGLRKIMMRNRFWPILGLLLLVSGLFLAGCATEGGYQGYERAYYRTPETEYPGPGPVPPSFYRDNPQYEHWFRAPEWMPDVGG